MIAFTRSAALCGFIAACFVAAAIAGTTPEGQAWLASKGKEDGVVSTGSGLLYKVLKNGPDGAKKPNIDTPCECHYKGTLIDGREFDSSYSRGMPATFAPNQVTNTLVNQLKIGNVTRPTRSSRAGRKRCS